MPVTSSAAVTLLRVCLILSAVAASVFCGCGRTQADRTDMFVLGTEDRGTYECLTIEMTVADGDRVKSYLLVPDHGPGDRLPAVLMLHDHGARFDIGKEKLACPPHLQRKPMLKCPEYIRNQERRPLSPLSFQKGAITAVRRSRIPYTLSLPVQSDDRYGTGVIQKLKYLAALLYEMSLTI